MIMIAKRGASKRTRLLGAFLPSPEQIRQRALEIRQRNGAGIPEATNEPDESDWREWRAEQERQHRTLAKMTPAQRRQLAEEEKREAERIAEEDRVKYRADLIRDLAGGEAQRRASVDAGTPVKEGKDVPHYRAFEALTITKVALGTTDTPESFMAAHGIKSGERKVREWLEGLSKQLAEGVYLIARIKVLDDRDPPLWRVVDARSVPLKMKSGQPYDRGGYKSRASAQEQADAMNAAARRRNQKPQTRKQRRASRSAQIAAERAKRGGAIHPPKLESTEGKG